MVFGRSLFRLHHAMSVFGRFQRNHAQYRAGDGGERKRFQDVSSRNGHGALRLQISFLRLIQQIIRSAPGQRHDGQRGILVGVGDKAAPSVTNRFFTSCAWQYWFKAEVAGCSPMRTVPTS